MEKLFAAYPDWPEIVGDPDEISPFRAWLLQQPADYQELVNSTESAEAPAPVPSPTPLHSVPGWAE